MKITEKKIRKENNLIYKKKLVYLSFLFNIIFSIIFIYHIYKYFIKINSFKKTF